MKQKLLAFFSGKNGADTLAKATLIPSLVLMLVSGFIGTGWLKYLLYLASLAGLIYAYFRMFSRDLYRRQKENRAFCEFFRIIKLKWRDRKTYRYYRCPECHEWMRVPRGRGSIKITCRVCKFRFDKTT